MLMLYSEVPSIIELWDMFMCYAGSRLRLMLYGNCSRDFQFENFSDDIYF